MGTEATHGCSWNGATRGHQHQPWLFMVLSCLLPPLSYPNGQNNCSASPCPAGSLTLPLPSKHSLRVLITAGRNSRTISTKVTSQARVEMPFKGPSIWHRWTFFAEVIQLINFHFGQHSSINSAKHETRESWLSRKSVPCPGTRVRILPFLTDYNAMFLKVMPTQDVPGTLAVHVPPHKTCLGQRQLALRCQQLQTAGQP